MKKEKFYLPPCIEVVDIESEDVFATSQGSTLEDFEYEEL